MRYLSEGDIVELNKDLPNKPTMMVHQVKKKQTNNSSPFNILEGIVCIWFTVDGYLQEKMFNSKDLIPKEDVQ